MSDGTDRHKVVTAGSDGVKAYAVGLDKVCSTAMLDGPATSSSTSLRAPHGRTIVGSMSTMLVSAVARSAAIRSSRRRFVVVAVNPLSFGL